MLRIEKLKIGGMPPLTFAVPAGQCMAIEGPSGSGKTRLLRAIADLDPSGGQVLFEGGERHEMPADKWRRKIRYVSAEPGWWTTTARESVKSNKQSDRFERLCTTLGLDTALLDRPLDIASTGERQRMALALALSDDPPVVLLDEPTGALDAANTALVEEQLRYLLLSEKTLVIVSHDPAQVKRLADLRLQLGPAGPLSLAASTQETENTQP